MQLCSVCYREGSKVKNNFRVTYRASSMQCSNTLHSFLSEKRQTVYLLLKLLAVTHSAVSVSGVWEEMLCVLVNMCSACMHFQQCIDGNVNNYACMWCGKRIDSCIAPKRSCSWTICMSGFIFDLEKYIGPLKCLLFRRSMVSMKAVTFAFALENLAMNRCVFRHWKCWRCLIISHGSASKRAAF